MSAKKKSLSPHFRIFAICPSSNSVRSLAVLVPLVRSFSFRSIRNVADSKREICVLVFLARSAFACICMDTVVVVVVPVLQHMQPGSGALFTRGGANFAHVHSQAKKKTAKSNSCNDGSSAAIIGTSAGAKQAVLGKSPEMRDSRVPMLVCGGRESYRYTFRGGGGGGVWGLRVYYCLFVSRFVRFKEEIRTHRYRLHSTEQPQH